LSKPRQLPKATNGELSAISPATMCHQFYIRSEPDFSPFTGTL
jgi:hypothetical protein